MRRDHVQLVLISLFVLTRHAAASSTPQDSLLEPFSLDESLVLGEPVAYGVLVNGGYQPFEPKEGDQGLLLTPGYLFKRDPDTLRFSSIGQLRLTVRVDEVLRSASSSVSCGVSIVVPQRADLLAGLPTGRRLYRIRHSEGGMSVVAMHGPCDTDACSHKLVEFARRAVSFLDLPEVPPRLRAELYFDLAADEDFWWVGLRLLNPPKAKQRDLLAQSTSLEVARLVALAIESGPLSDRFLATLELPFESMPPALWVEACRGIEDAIRLEKGLTHAATAIDTLLRHRRIASVSSETDGAACDARAAGDSALKLFSRRFELQAEGTAAHAPLLRHIWLGLVKSGRVPGGRYESYWWQPDLERAALKHLERIDGNRNREYDDGVEYEESPDEWESCWAVSTEFSEENQTLPGLTAIEPSLTSEP